MSELKRNVISFINMKGGVGKTTITISLADYLAEQGKKVLLIDMDPQHNSTLTILDVYKNEVQKRWTAEEKKQYDEIIQEKKISDSFYSMYYEYLADKNNRKTIIRLFENSIYEDVGPGLSIVTKITDQLDMVCGDLALIFSKNGSNKRLRSWIEDNKIKSLYDYILIDCPPTLTMYTDAALVASDYYVIPNQIERYSIRGIELLSTTIKQLSKEEKIAIECLGIVYTMVPTKKATKLDDIRDIFEKKIKLDIFNTKFYYYNYYKTGLQGNIAGRYTKSGQDIRAFTVEFEDMIRRKGENNE